SAAGLPRREAQRGDERGTNRLYLLADALLLRRRGLGALPGGVAASRTSPGRGGPQSPPGGIPDSPRGDGGQIVRQAPPRRTRRSRVATPPAPRTQGCRGAPAGRAAFRRRLAAPPPGPSDEASTFEEAGTRRAPILSRSVAIQIFRIASISVDRDRRL